ncbi:hypothetical protein H8K52_15965 [Undibacterium seohonense]|jgi:hypothetical protein|uniref:Uncharacterized protein n=1 Tax=Undibacterium seohonense TaxID=1344950 RepID=A0ABR6X864_9BURK|nr:hypothetical protein [Undibacterium seohonense]MBC3808838.1 hypothetical protein [Undibacterium seohonense]
MSGRKKRKQERLPREDLVVARVREVADLPFVTQIEDHFAGMWNELGIQIKMNASTPDSEVIRLRNEVLKCLKVIDQENELPFTWIVGFWRDEKNIEVLLPQDDVKSLEDTLRAV